MDDPFSCKQKGDGYMSLPRGWNSNLEYSYTDASELMNFDAYAGWCNSPSNVSDLILPSFALSPLTATSASFSPFDGNNFTDQCSPGVPLFDGDVVGSTSLSREKVICDAVDMVEIKDNSSSHDNVQGKMVCSGIPRSSMLSLSEKMLRALCLFKESSGSGILAQLWVPVKKGDQYILSTCEQPYLLDKILSGYREVSRTFTFSTEIKPGSFPGLPGRVFNSKVPEWTSNVRYYDKAEYLRVQYAVDHEVRGSIALPIFEDDSPGNCCAVLELVTVKEKSNFNTEMDNLCRALQAVKLRSTSPPRLYHQILSKYQKAALAEITDVLRAICHAHRLPLALTWIPCSYVEGSCGEVRNTTPNEKSILCIEDAACYVNDKNTLGFVHACREHYLELGQGIVGKALQSNHPFFYGDVKEYHISEYPLAHHARKFGLNAAVAIRLRSTYTGDNDYILELFLPVDMKGSNEQQLLLNSLSNTIQRICKSLRTVSDSELLGTEYSKDRLKDVEVKNMGPTALSLDCVMQDGSESKSEEMEAYGHDEKTWDGPRKLVEKKRSTTEKRVSLSVLQQYFAGSLKDAAKSIGVCPTTLKRICRQHGISRWPSRKINKVNRSLMRIQNVLDSVQGVEAGLQFDPTVGGRVHPSSFIHAVDSKSSPLSPNKTNVAIQSPNPAPLSTAHAEVGSAVVKTEKECVVDGAHFAGVSLRSKGSCPPEATHEEIESNSKNDTWMDRDGGVVEHNQPTSSVMTNSSNGSGSGSMTKGSSSSSRSFGESGSKITVKATYKEDVIRFKLESVVGCMQLYEEIASRFKLQMGNFQLKYLDDETEWVLLISDSDLTECLEIMEHVGKRNVKFLVRDVPITVGSSGSSDCFMGGGSL